MDYKMKASVTMTIEELDSLIRTTLNTKTGYEITGYTILASNHVVFRVNGSALEYPIKWQLCPEAVK